MNKFLVILAFISSALSSVAQNKELASLWNYYRSNKHSEAFTKFTGDTLFMDKDWKTCARGKARFYRVFYPIDSSFIVQDYYISGIMQMEALCSSGSKPAINGHVIYYYKNGKLKAEGICVNNKQTGIWKYKNENQKDSSTFDYDAPVIEPYDSLSLSSQNQSSLFLINASYRCKLNRGYLSSGNGFGFEIGLNLGYFFSQKLLAAVFYGHGNRDFLWNTSYTKQYLDDFNAAYNGTGLRGNDSIIMTSLVKFINEGIVHDATSYYGIMLRLPIRHMPIIKLYTGSIASVVKVSRTSNSMALKPYASTDESYDHDYFNMNRKLDWGIEVFLYNGISRVRSYDSFSGKRLGHKKLRWNTNTLGLSLYLEKTNALHTSLDFSDGYHHASIPFESVLTRDFMQKYKTDYNFGIKLTCGIF